MQDSPAVSTTSHTLVPVEMVQGLPTWNVPAAQAITGIGAGADVGHRLQVTGHSVRTVSPYNVALLHIVATAGQFGANPPEPASTSAADASMHGADGAGAGADVGGTGVEHALQVTGHAN